jgi:hypothetical protein
MDRAYHDCDSFYFRFLKYVFAQDMQRKSSCDSNHKNILVSGENADRASMLGIERGKSLDSQGFT